MSRVIDRPLGVAALVVAAGVLLSGPIGMGLAMLHPQPPWVDAATFAARFHPVQQAPFWFGFVLIFGCAFFVARAAALSGEALRTRAAGALVATAAFVAMIATNYTLQVAFVPAAARVHDPSLALFSMANPRSIAWALEMFGYGVFGVATWLIAPAFRAGRFGRTTAWLLVANGVVSVVAAALTSVDLAWLLGPIGLLSFAVWNVLLFAVAILVAVAHLGRSPRAPDGPAL